MPRDAGGNYTLPVGNPVADGTEIDVDWANPTMNDIAAQLNNVLTRDGVCGPLFPMYFTNGSQAVPALSFLSEPQLGFYRQAARNLVVVANNLELARWTATGYSLQGTLSVAGASTFTGIPSGPTAAVDTNTTQLATTAYVTGQGYLKSASAAATYAPLGGAGASGTWGINISGSAPWSGITGPPAITGLTADTNATANTVARRDASGYLRAVYYNQSSGTESPTMGAVFVENSGADGYLRKITTANFISQLALAQTSGAVTFSGLVKGNGGGAGLGQITVSTSAPSGGSDGGLWLQY